MSVESLPLPITTSSSGSMIEVRNLSRRFGRKTALRDVMLSVPPGVVYGLAGENGAGKTTLIKHLLGLYKAQTGSVRLFGLDPVKDPPGVLGQIGYLSEDRDLPEWMRVRELIRYSQAFYPQWDASYSEELRETFELGREEKIRNLSRGQKAKMGLLIALAHRPRLLLLDEPSSGLDPVVRRDILGAIIRTVAGEGRTVFFSSHLLDEVERVADRVAMLHQGSIVFDASLDELKAVHTWLTLQFDEPPGRPPVLPGVLNLEGGGREWMALFNGRRSEFDDAVEKLGARIVAERPSTLEEIFIGRVGARSIASVPDSDAHSSRED